MVNENFPQLDHARNDGELLVNMETSAGMVTVKLFPEMAPKAVENFVTHAKNGYYEGTIFHRVIQDFMIQGGDPTGTGMGGESIYGEPFEDEFSPLLFHFRGAVSMANSGPNTNGSQFFIVQNQKLNPSFVKQMEDAGYPNKAVEKYKTGGTPWLDFRHTVFGQVIGGMDVVDQIASVQTDPMDKPLEPIVIKRVEIQD